MTSLYLANLLSRTHPSGSDQRTLVYNVNSERFPVVGRLKETSAQALSKVRHRKPMILVLITAAILIVPKTPGSPPMGSFASEDIVKRYRLGDTE